MKWLFLVFHMKLTCLAPHSHVVLLPNQRLVTQSISLPPWWSRCWDSKELLFSCSVVSDSLQPPWTAARQASLSFTISQSFLKLMPIELVMPSHHLTLCCPLLLLPSVFPGIRAFSIESALRKPLWFLTNAVSRVHVYSIMVVSLPWKMPWRFTSSSRLPSLETSGCSLSPVSIVLPFWEHYK